jgi:hypothetical protein
MTGAQHRVRQPERAVWRQHGADHQPRSVRGLGDLALDADIQAARRAGGCPVVGAVELEDLGAHPADAGQAQVEAGTGGDGPSVRLTTSRILAFHSISRRVSVQ